MKEIIKQEKIYIITKKEICDRLGITEDLQKVNWNINYDLSDKPTNAEVLQIRVIEKEKELNPERLKVFGQ